MTDWMLGTAPLREPRKSDVVSMWAVPRGMNKEHAQEERHATQLQMNIK